MKQSLFIYIILNFLAIQLPSLELDTVTNVLKVLSIIGILTIGISHGAIDDVLHFKKLKVNKGPFIFKYVVAIIAYAALWYLFPNAAALGFILISGYHFGQSQFIDYKFTNWITSNLIYLSWGSLVLFIFFYCNAVPLIKDSSQYFGIPKLLIWLIQNAKYFIISFSVILLVNFIHSLIKKKISFQNAIMELLLLFAISTSFALIDPLIAFSLFFVILHSYHVMIHEINFLEVKSNGEFIKTLLPFTIISLVGFTIILSGLYFLGLEIYIPLVTLIIISSVTTPHSFIMAKFYSSNDTYHADWT